MKKLLLPLAAVTAVFFLSGCSGTANGEALFKEKCAGCHPNGGNIIRGNKGLKKEYLLNNNIKNANDIVTYLRKPGPEMPVFSEQSLSVKDATDIANYILKTY